ncbi:MAG: DAK2 domain-containing protein [Blastochloris sp.]|nr:DAK2 domain-containing protein [Blastochloris sp.]
MVTIYREETDLIADGLLIKRLLRAGAHWLESNKEIVNRLNVFPVPDGDTGTNMAYTMRQAYRHIEPLEERHVGRVLAAAAEGALLGARGNSGVILSQLWAGVADVLHAHETLDASALAKAARAAFEMAYKAVQKPVEGTILTVARAMMQAIDRYHRETANLTELLKRMIAAGRTALRRTPDLLPILKEKGVVDSGGKGLVLIFEGMVRELAGKNTQIETEMTVVNPSRWRETIEPDDEEGYGYDVQFLMRGRSLNIDRVRDDLNHMGWSTLVVGDNHLIKVHIHVHDPGVPLSYAINLGASLDDVVVENMQQQYQNLLEKPQPTPTPVIRTDVSGAAVVAVASGPGLQNIFTSVGAAYVITGGQTMNPSVGDFWTRSRRCPTTRLFCCRTTKM